MESSLYRENEFYLHEKKNYFHINGFSLSLALLVLSLASRGFSPGTPVFPSSKKPTLPNSNSIWDALPRLSSYLQLQRLGTTRKLLSLLFLRTKTLPGTQQLLRTFYSGHDARSLPLYLCVFEDCSSYIV